MQSWLEKIPGLKEDGFNFWSQYQKAVEKMLKDLEEEIKAGHTYAKQYTLHKSDFETSELYPIYCIVCR